MGTRNTNGRFGKKLGAGASAGSGEETGPGPVRPGLTSEIAAISVETADRSRGMMETAAALEAEAMAATASAPEDLEHAPASGPGSPGAPAGPAGPTDEEVLAGYTMICGELVDAGAVAIVPAWRVTPAESSKLAGALARALMLWFPDMIIPPKYLALLTVAGVAFEIAQVRRDSNGRYLPARLTTPAQQAAGESAAQAPAH